MHFVTMTLSVGVGLGILGCSGNPESTSPVQTEAPTSYDNQEELDVLAKRWKRSQNDFTARMKDLSDIERLYVVRQVLANPKVEHSPRLCQTLSKQPRDYCMEMLNRSHIWDIPVADDRSQVPPSSGQNTTCAPSDVWCQTAEAIQDAKHGKIDNARAICTSLPDTQAREECFFQTAEQVAKQDQPSSLETAFQLCAETVAYRSHCHAHIIEFAAATFQPPTEQLKVIGQYGATQASFLQEYFLTMKARYSPSNPHLPHWDRHSVQTLIFLDTQTKADHPLTHWIELFEDILPTLNTRELKQDEEINNYWIQQGKAQHPSKLYLSLETRPFSENESQDLQLAMVAGLIQRHFPVDTIRAESQNTTIQWMLNRASHKR